MKLLMVRPDFYDVEYAINPHMKNADGSLKRVDRQKALSQWLELKNTFESLGAEVDVLPGQKNLPDMVYAANQAVVFTGRAGQAYVLSKMKSSFREPEVRFFDECLKTKGYSKCEIDFGDLSFEGTGDLIWDPYSKMFWAGHGFRTDERAHRLFEQKTSIDCKSLKLVSEHFYHLDTCFMVLGTKTAAYVPEAFDSVSRKLLESHFSDLIVCELDEAKNGFCLNGFKCGETIVLQRGAEKYKSELTQRELRVIEVNTSEFIKGGGSVFCMKLVLEY
jgi:N-dimethylarginine dimethylaminohydrolase